MTPAITASLARLDGDIAAMEARHPGSVRDDLGMLPCHHDEVAASVAEAYRQQERDALRYLWKGQAPQKRGGFRAYGWDEYMDGWRAPPTHRRTYRFLVRLAVSAAILMKRWAPPTLDNEDVVFWDQQRGYGWSCTVLSFNPKAFTVAVYQDSE